MSAEPSPETSPKVSPAPSPLPESEQVMAEEKNEPQLVFELGEEQEGEAEEGDIEEEEESIPEDHLCHICNSKLKDPSVLSCLHVFCRDCVQKQLEPNTPDEEKPKGCAIVCNVCGQETKLGPKGVDEILPDYVMVNTLDMEAILKMQIVCTSCKAKEKAVARCSDCANFLCPNCVTAHQYMRCFEDHKVVSFEEMQSKGGFSLHKPLFCNNHSTESLKYFCTTCEVPVCTECMVTEHRQPEHDSRRLADVEEASITTIKSLVGEAKEKIVSCEETTSNLENLLSELQMQRDNAKGLIDETFQTYKAILEKRKDTVLAELEEIHSSQEDSIMHVFDNVGKTIEKIEDGCKFADRILAHGNATEVLLMKRLIKNQLGDLVKFTASPDINVKIQFDTDSAQFEKNIEAVFGSFQKGKEVEVNPSTMEQVPSFEAAASGLLSPNTSEFIPTMQPLPPLSLATLAPSIPQQPSPQASAITGVSPQTINSIASSIQSLATGAQPATVIDRSSSRNSYSPAMSDSGISMDAPSNGTNTNQSIINVAALAKLGTVNVNNQGQITLNGQIIPGLTVNNVAGLSQVLPNRAPTPTTPMTPDTQNLANILGSVSAATPAVSQCPTTPQLGDITQLLTTPPIWPQGVPPPSGIGATPGLTPVPHTVPPPFAARKPAKVSAMQISCKFGNLGPVKGQFNSPHGFCLGIDEDIVVADTNNHRIQVFEKTGDFKYQFGIPGREEGQLWYPRKVAVIRYSGKYVVCDRGNERSRMQIFTKNGHFLKKIAIRYIDIVAGLAITQTGHIVAVDSVSPTVFVIAETGDLTKWFDCSDYMREPSDIAVNGKEYFVCDFKGHCVVVFNEDGQFLRRIGCENITNFPNGIDVSDAGDVLIGDSHGNRFHVAVFQKDGSLIREFECPYVKVSRCCGLKITLEGYIVTLAKNNHHVLVLNTLYIT